MLIALITGCIASPAWAQGPWSVVLGGGAAGFGGASTLSAGFTGDEKIKPSPTTRLHLGVARALGRAGLVLDASYAKAGLGVYGVGGSYSFTPGETLYDVRLLASYQIVRFGPAASLRLAAGPMLQIWSGEAIVDTQTGLGGALAITVDAPLTRAFGLMASGSIAVAGSPFSAENLASAGPFEPANIWTRELGVGIRVAF
jgi:hypothetical protein